MQGRDELLDPKIEKDRSRIARRELRQKERELNDMRKLLTMPEFRRFLWVELSLCGIFNNPFNPNAALTNFNCGIQQVGQKLLQKLNEADMYAFAKIQQEYLSEQRSFEIQEEKERQDEQEQSE